MTTATELQAQLRELWETAEQATPKKGDTYIACNDTKDWAYSVGVARWELDPGHYRILERAKPKAPEVVMAGVTYNLDARREPFMLLDNGAWLSPSHYAGPDELVDPVPLVELPEWEAVAGALRGVSDYPRRATTLDYADAVLELLRGEDGA